jgi:branched-chain amino acid transport system substrate-binding protein
MVRTLATLGTRQLAVVYQNNELGRFMLPIVKTLAQQHDATLVATVPAQPDGSNGTAAAKAVADARERMRIPRASSPRSSA